MRLVTASGVMLIVLLSGCRPYQQAELQDVLAPNKDGIYILYRTVMMPDYQKYHCRSECNKDYRPTDKDDVFKVKEQCSPTEETKYQTVKFDPNKENLKNKDLIRLVAAPERVFVGDLHKKLDAMFEAGELEAIAKRLGVQKELGKVSSKTICETGKPISGPVFAKVSTKPESDIRRTVLKGHTHTVTSVAFNKNGTQVITGSRDATAKIWNAQTGELFKTFRHKSGVVDVAFSADGKHILTVTESTGAHLWEIGSQMEKEVKNDGKQAAASTGAQPAANANAAQPATSTTAPAQAAPPKKIVSISDINTTSALLSPDGKTILTTSSDKTIKLWNVTNGATKWTKTLTEGPARALGFSKDSTKVIASSVQVGKAIVTVYNRETGEVIKTYDGHTGAVHAAGFSPSGLQLITGSEDKTANLYDATAGNVIHTFVGHEFPIHAAVFSPLRGHAQVATGSWDATIKLWNPDTGKLITTINDNGSPIYDLAYHPRAGRLAAAVSFAKTAIIWNLSQVIPKPKPKPVPATGGTQGQAKPGTPPLSGAPAKSGN